MQLWMGEVTQGGLTRGCLVFAASPHDAKDLVVGSLPAEPSPDVHIEGNMDCRYLQDLYVNPGDHDEAVFIEIGQQASA